MSAFTGPVTITQTDVYLWRLDSTLTWEVDYIGSGRFITVNPGFVSDGASVPRPLWAIWPAWGRYTRSAIVHDYVCWALDRKQPDPSVPSFRSAARLFYHMLLVEHVNRISAALMFAGVYLWAIMRDVFK